jgi:hypothetical protein
MRLCKQKQLKTRIDIALPRFSSRQKESGGMVFAMPPRLLREGRRAARADETQFTC